MSVFLWAYPQGLWALAALAAVALLYIFYRRYRPLPVTGLFLWGAPPRDAAGGRKARGIRLLNMAVDRLKDSVLAALERDGTRINAQMIFSRLSLTHGKLPKK